MKSDDDDGDNNAATTKDLMVVNAYIPVAPRQLRYRGVTRVRRSLSKRAVRSDGGQFLHVAFKLRDGQAPRDVVDTFCARENISLQYRRSILVCFRALLDEYMGCECRKTMKQWQPNSEAATKWSQWFLSNVDWSYTPSSSSSSSSPSLPQSSSQQQQQQQQQPAVASSSSRAFQRAFVACTDSGQREHTEKLFHAIRRDALALANAFSSMDESLTKLRLRHARDMDALLAEINDNDDDDDDGNAYDTTADDDDVDDGNDDVDTATIPPPPPAAAAAAPIVNIDNNDDDETPPMTVFQHQSNTDRISQLVNRHVGGAQSLEDRWRREIDKLKRKQQDHFRTFVQSVYDNELNDAADVLQQQQQQQRRREPLDSYCNRDDIILDRQVWMGTSQCRTQYTVRLVAGDIVDNMCVRSFSEREHTTAWRVAERLYTNELSAIILPHHTSTVSDMNGVAASGRLKTFIHACDRYTEYHFPSLRSQIRRIIRVCEKSATDLQPGDCFITRHSNLLRVHVVFHLADGLSLERVDDDGGFDAHTDPVLGGLQQVVLLANRCGVRSLHIPLLFYDTTVGGGGRKSSKPVDDAHKKWIRSCMRGVRACLADIPLDEDDCSLREVCFMVPVVTQSLLGFDDESNRRRSPLQSYCIQEFNQIFAS